MPVDTPADAILSQYLQETGAGRGTVVAFSPPVGSALTDEDPGAAEEFQKRLRRDLLAARKLLRRPGFGEGETTIGAELEVSLVDDKGSAAMLNREVLGAMADHHMTVELDRFNLEFNADPLPLEGRPFEKLGRDMERALKRIDKAARGFGAQVIAVGTLPSLELETLRSVETMTDLPRYRALAVALRSFRKKPFELDIDGVDPLSAKCDGVTLEGANTSLQIHLRTPPTKFADTYNAAQLATPIALALAGNSPLFCGHRLWEETRIAVFKQAVDIRTDRASGVRPPRVCFGHGWTREGVYELLAEAVHIHEPLLPVRQQDAVDGLHVVETGGVPTLDDLRLHLGTIWRWNRPVLDTSKEGHLRIELRALPSGPTVIDMMATTAFYLGLTLGLRNRIRDLISAIPFEFVRTSFYRAAARGLDAELFWPAAAAPSPELVLAANLARRLIPVAREGLIGAGVAESSATKLLNVIGQRLATRQTGAQWQRAALATLNGPGRPSKESLARLTLAYLELAKTNTPVHTWPIPNVR